MTTNYQGLNEMINSPIHGSINSLSIAAPAYNEQDGIEEVVENWVKYLRNNPNIKEFEIVICNDGSVDNTKMLLDKMAQKNPEINVLHLEKNQGAAVALTCAIENTKNDWVLLLDSDGQFPVENFKYLSTAIIDNNAKAVIGVRQKKDSMYARFGTRASGFVCNLIYGVTLKDFNSACKLIDGRLLRSIYLEAKGMNYSTEVTAKLLERKAPISEVDIDHRPRVTGSSNMKLIKGSIHRFLFVLYLAFRKFLLANSVIQLQSRIIENIN